MYLIDPKQIYVDRIFEDRKYFISSQGTFEKGVRRGNLGKVVSKEGFAVN